jgi:hypothetical protein
MLSSDVGPKTTEAILGRLRASLERSELQDADAVWAALKAEAANVAAGYREKLKDLGAELDEAGAWPTPWWEAPLGPYVAVMCAEGLLRGHRIHPLPRLVPGALHRPPARVTALLDGLVRHLDADLEAWAQGRRER